MLSHIVISYLFTLQLYLLVFITIMFIAVIKKNKIKNKIFISLECKYNKLQFGIRISFIEVRKQKLCISMSLYVYNKIYSNKIHPGMTLVSRAQGFRGFSSKHRCLCSLPQQPETAVKTWKRRFLMGWKQVGHCCFFFFLLMWLWTERKKLWQYNKCLVLCGSFLIYNFVADVRLGSHSFTSSLRLSTTHLLKHSGLTHSKTWRPSHSLIHSLKHSLSQTLTY